MHSQLLLYFSYGDENMWGSKDQRAVEVCERDSVFKKAGSRRTWLISSLSIILMCNLSLYFSVRGQHAKKVSLHNSAMTDCWGFMIYCNFEGSNVSLQDGMSEDAWWSSKKQDKGNGNLSTETKLHRFSVKCERIRAILLVLAQESTVINSV